MYEDIIKIHESVPMNFRVVVNEEHDATLNCFLLPTEGEYRNIRKRPCVIVIPGGGYQMRSTREAENICYPYMQAGYHAFVLRYAIGTKAKWPNPLSDYEEAVKIIREHAEEWHIYEDKICVIGFSAGGHLAASAAVMSENRPNAAILGYPVLEEATAKACHPTAPDLVSQVDLETCPCFIAATCNDEIVPISNSLSFMNALNQHGISFESHIYAFGPHGFAGGESTVTEPGTISERCHHWISDSIGWLKELFGDFSWKADENGEFGMTAPRFSQFAFEDFTGHYSAECRVRALMKDEACIPILNEAMDLIVKKREEKTGTKMPGLDFAKVKEEHLGFMATLKLRSAMIYDGVAEEDIRRIDEKLRAIK